MNLFSTFKLVSSSALCAALVGCQTTAEQAPPTAVRTRAPQGYEKAIIDYLAFRIRGPQKNAEINIGAPEPSGCAIDSFANSSRGWVVPVAYATRTGVPSGKETINIATRQYYFWFLGDTIAGLSPRIDLCPGATLTEFPQPSAADGPLASAAVSAPARSDASGREGAGAAEAAKTGLPPDGAKAAGQKGTSANKTQKAVRKPVKKPAPSPDKV
jgi:hypothetical protein